MYFRRIHIDMIPVHDAGRFEDWLFDQWREKDRLIEHYQNYGRFPADSDTSSPPGPVGAGYIETEVKLRSAWEIGKLFIVLIILALVAYVLALFHNVVRYGHLVGKG